MIINIISSLIIKSKYISRDYELIYNSIITPNVSIDKIIIIMMIMETGILDNQIALGI
jgi:hypothetical protein